MTSPMTSFDAETDLKPIIIIMTASVCLLFRYVHTISFFFSVQYKNTDEMFEKNVYTKEKSY